MNHIYIIHAGEDSGIAERLHDDLHNAGHDARIDTYELKLGMNSIQFMNEGIAQASKIIILYSKHTTSAAWQKSEIDGAFWNEVEQRGAKCIVMRLDDTLLPPLLGPKVFATLAQDLSNYASVLEAVCDAVLPAKTPSSIMADAFEFASPNPFRRVRAEFFEDVPKLLAEAFAPPDAMKMSALEEMKPCFLEGSRGTGKSMLLLALRARNLASRRNAKPISQLFGFYLKLSRGAVCNAGISVDQNSDPDFIKPAEGVQVTDAFSQEIVLCLLESLFSEIKFCIQEQHVSCDAHCEHALATEAYRLLTGVEPIHQLTIDGLLAHMANIHRDLANFIRRKFIYRESVSVPITILDIEMLKSIFRFSKQTLPALRNSMFVILLDEYENLFPFQQRVINGLVKLAAPDFTVKVAKKLGGEDVSGTTTGQELQEIHDYNRVTLVYDVEDASQMRLYAGLLQSVTEKLLTNAGLLNGDLNSLLPHLSGSEVDEKAWSAEMADILNISVSDFANMSVDCKNEKINHYSEAATYRVLYKRGGRQKEKVFAGFNELSFLSSGVIRYFLEILGVAFHLQYAGGSALTSPIPFAAETQTQAVHIVSQHYLTTLSRNVEVYGERLKYYVLDLGDCLRHKLLYHSSEPEAGRLTIDDPQSLEDVRFAEMKKVLSLGIREGVFQTREGRPAFKPKHRSDPQPAEVSICRIYAPVLQISPRQRWRTRVSCDELLGLWNPDSRATMKKRLIKKMASISHPHPRLNLGGSDQ